MVGGEPGQADESGGAAATSAAEAASAKVFAASAAESALASAASAPGASEGPASATAATPDARPPHAAARVIVAATKMRDDRTGEELVAHSDAVGKALLQKPPLLEKVRDHASRVAEVAGVRSSDRRLCTRRPPAWLFPVQRASLHEKP